MNALITGWLKVTDGLEQAGQWLGLLFLRLILAYEFYEAGINKLNGDNWFSHVQDKFPFPFNVLPVELSWFLATWAEVLGGLLLFFGLFTRFWSATLIIVTIVAIFGVHWPDDWSSLGELWKGFAITDKGFGNYKLPLIYLVMFIPLLLLGPGKASADYWIRRSVAGS